MKQLKEQFTKNGLPYILIKRNDLVAMYGVGGTYTEKILHYEVCKIHIIKTKYVSEREVIPGNEQFGRDGSEAIVNRKEADQYFDKLTGILRSKKQTAQTA